MSKEKAAVEKVEADKAKKKEERKREKKREKLRQELLQGVKDSPDKQEVDKEKVISAVAEEMLKVFSGWPEEIQALIGTDQPNKESFVHGINYVVGAYLLKATRVLRKQTVEGIKSKEAEVARLMGPLADQISRLRKTQQKVDEDEVARLKVEKETRIREATAAISREYNEKIHKIQGGKSEALEALDEQVRGLSNEYHKTKANLEDNEQLLLSIISDLGKPYAGKELPAVKVSKETAAVLAVAAAVSAP